MFCENCGLKLRENAAFFPKCGTAVKPEDHEETKEKDRYTSLALDADADENESVSERPGDKDKPIFKDEGDTYVRLTKDEIIIVSSTADEQENCNIFHGIQKYISPVAFDDAIELLQSSKIPDSINSADGDENTLAENDDVPKAEVTEQPTDVPK